MKPIHILSLATTPHQKVDSIVSNFEQHLSIEYNIPYRLTRSFKNTIQHAHQILQDPASHPDIILAISTENVLVAKSLLEHYKLDIPVITAHVMAEVAAMPVTHQAHVTGTLSDLREKLDLTFESIKGLKRAVILYDQRFAFINKMKEISEELFSAHSIHCFTSTIQHSNTPDIREYIKTADLVLVFAFDTDKKTIYDLRDICEKNGVLLCTSDANDLKRGAPLVFAINYKKIGRQCAQFVAEFARTQSFVSNQKQIEYTFTLATEILERNPKLLARVNSLRELIENTKIKSPGMQEKIAAHFRLETIPLD